MKDFYASFPPYSFGAVIQVHVEVQVQEEAKGKVGEKMIGCVGRLRLSSTLAGHIFTYQAGFREFDYW